MAPDQHWLVTVALVTSSLIAVAANSLLLVVFCRRRGLRTVSNRFTINLLLTNLLSSVLLIPLMVVDQKASAPANITAHGPEENLQAARNFFLRVRNASASGEIIFQEEKAEEVVESGAFERTAALLFSDRFKLSILENTTGGEVVENVTDFSELTYLRHSERMSVVLCYVAQSVVGLVCTASILSVLLIGVDQYFAVIHSLRYHSYIDKFRSMALIVASWVVSILFGIFGALTQSESSLWKFCARDFDKMTDGLKTINFIYALTYFLLVILVPFLAICVIYVCIYAAARNNSERMRKSTKGNNQPSLDNYIQITKDRRIPSESRLSLQANSKEEITKVDEIHSTKGLTKVQSAPNFSNLINSKDESAPSASPHTNVKRTCSERVSFINNLKYKISNASVFRYREESRAAKISILVIFMVLICYIPYGVAVLLNSPLVGVTTPQLYNFISLILLVFSNIISPFLFAYRNRRIRRELLKFLGIAPSRSSSMVRRSIVRPKPVELPNQKMIAEEGERTEADMSVQPFLSSTCVIPQVIITCKVESERTEKGSILKRVCSGKNWQNYKKCSFINVPESCWQTDSARGSFSSASTQISTED